MKFNLFFSAAGLIMLSVAILFDVNYINYERPLPYSRWQEISFHKFKGIKKPAMTLDGMSEFAYIKISREIYFPDHGTIGITTWFHPSRSYVFSRDIRNPDLLRHELYHFHIAEYCTRLLRKEIVKKNDPLTRRMISELDTKYYELENQLQSEYDNDSYHSYVLQAQKKWEMRIDSLLVSLQAFSDPVLRISNRE
jgi:hypothetical protein